MREKDLENKLVKAVRNSGGLAMKFISPNLNDFPVVWRVNQVYRELPHKKNLILANQVIILRWSRGTDFCLRRWYNAADSGYKLTERFKDRSGFLHPEFKKCSRNEQAEEAALKARILTLLKKQSLSNQEIRQITGRIAQRVRKMMTGMEMEGVTLIGKACQGGCPALFLPDPYGIMPAPPAKAAG